MGNLFGKKPQPQNAVRMPSEGDAATRAAEARKRREISERQGRTSTILSRGTSSGGTTSYTNSLLGSA